LKVAVDTNVLAYAEGLDDDHRRRMAQRVLGGVSPDDLTIPVQVLGELFNIFRRKMRLSATAAGERIQIWRDIAACPDTSLVILLSAITIAQSHDLSTWDAVILAAAAEAGCRVLLSEDMQHGFTWSGVTVVNPFAEPPHPLLEDLLA
jgi:predicted nucleic acid-binding protein